MAAARPAKVEHWSRWGIPPRPVRPTTTPHSPADPRSGESPELDCVRNTLPARTVAAAERRARDIGVGAERALICAGVLTEKAYLVALSGSLGACYEPLRNVSRTDCPLGDDALIEAAAAGILPLRLGHDLVWVICPRGLIARRLANPAESNPPSPESFRLTSSEDLRGFLERHCQPALGHRAASRLLLSYPEFSNAPGADIRRSTKFTVNVICVLAFCIAAPVAVVEMLSGILCALFVAAGFLRLLSPWYGRHGSPDTGS